MRNCLFRIGLSLAVISALGCFSGGHSSLKDAPIPLQVAKPIDEDAVSGCYLATAADGMGFQWTGYWSAPVRLDSEAVSAEFARKIGEPRAFRVTSRSKSPDRDSPMLSTVWYIHGPDSLYIARVGAFGGESMRLVLSDSVFVGEWSSTGDVIDEKAAPIVIRVLLRRVAC